MPAYVVPRDRGPAIREGRQLLTLVAPRVHDLTNPHARVGKDVSLDLAAKAGKKRERVATKPCVLRAQLVITPGGLLRVLDLTFPERGDTNAAGDKLARLVRAAEQGAPGNLAAARLALAKAAGFRSWKALYDYNAGVDQRGRPDENGHVTRELIGWAA